MTPPDDVSERLECPFCEKVVPDSAGGCSCGRDRETLRNLSERERERAKINNVPGPGDPDYEMSEGERQALGRYWG